MASMHQILGISFLARIALIIYGVWQDANMAVKFTDVDYFVFSDAAEYVSQGESPYLRSTYRYTPLLAWALTPNIWLTHLFGKIVFIIFDNLVGQMIYSLLVQQGYSHKTARNCCLLWLLNPLSATVSSRGNAESIMAFLVITSLKFLVSGKIVAAAIFYALSIHFKIYPVTYALPIYLYLGNGDYNLNNYGKTTKQNTFNSLKWFVMYLLPNKERCIFGFVSAIVLGSLTLLFYSMYGWVFIYETYLYHVVRGDIRHNFSPYFYLLYLTTDAIQGVPLFLRLLVFVPQLSLLLSIAYRYHHDQPVCWFLSTFVFVMANKVCTSQYFLWYLSLLPVIIPSIKLNLKSGLAILLLWFVGQGLWLLPAYYLEFEGHNTFLFVWIFGLVFYVINAYIVHFIIVRYSPKANKNKTEIASCSKVHNKTVYN